MNFYRYLIILLAISTIKTKANTLATDSINSWGWSLNLMKSKVLSMDKYQKLWMKYSKNSSVELEVIHNTLPKDSDCFAYDFNYPTLSLGLRYTINNYVKLHRSPNEAWGKAKEVDYDSKLGNTFSSYITFRRAIHRSNHWKTEYSLSAGIGINSLWYNKTNNIDNELIGSPLLIYFGTGIHQSYQFADNWAIRGGIEFVHHSNGALARPNKGSNSLGTSIGIVYQPYTTKKIIYNKKAIEKKTFKKYCYFNTSIGIGAKTLLEEWQLTQFHTEPSEPNYRTGKFKLYLAYSMQFDFMYRYARRWASGIGFDYFYGSYFSRIKQMDNLAGYNIKHSPISLGIALKHEVFYHNLSLSMGIGGYIYRYMGKYITDNEPRYYERIGVNYSFQKLGNIKIGIIVKAHYTKADLTELVISYPIKL